MLHIHSRTLYRAFAYLDHLHRDTSIAIIFQETTKTMKPALRQLCCLILLSLAVLVTESNAKPDKPVSSPPPIDFSELDKLVAEELKERNTPGAVITVVSGDQVVYQKAFGVANVETNAAMQPEMLFRLGSTTKMFTAAALVTLAENNKIKMNEPIGQRIKGLNPEGCECHAASLVEQLRGRTRFCRACDLKRRRFARKHGALVERRRLLRRSR